MENAQLNTENAQLRKDLGIRYHIANAVGVSPIAQLLLQKIEKYSSNNDPVLITGETGTGKTDVARMIHYNSVRASHPILFFDCATVPEPFQETQLFGEEMGERDGLFNPGHSGLVEKSHMGSLVLTNIHLLNRKCQARLAGVLQNQKTQRVGGPQFYHTNFRLMATTTAKDFKGWVNSRADLIGMISLNIVEIPPLRDHKEDIPLLALIAAKRLGRTYSRNIEKLSPEIIDHLTMQDFFGNYDELELMIEKAVVKCFEPTLKLEHLKGNS